MSLVLDFTIKKPKLTFRMNINTNRVEVEVD